jgi:hypothetical protein
MPRRTVAIGVSLDTRAEGREQSSGVRPLLPFARSRGRYGPLVGLGALIGLGWASRVRLAGRVRLGHPDWAGPAGLGWATPIGPGRPG